MRTVHSVSFPRSGHRLTTELLRAYFGPSFIYSGEIEANPDAHFIKHHDFELSSPIDSAKRYLVQIRDPIDSVHSWMKLTSELEGLRESRACFTRLFDQKIDYWVGFVRKWVLPEYPNVWVFLYRDVSERSSEALKKMIPIFGEAPVESRVVAAVQSMKIYPRRCPPFAL